MSYVLNEKLKCLQRCTCYLGTVMVRIAAHGTPFSFIAQPLCLHYNMLANSHLPGHLSCLLSRSCIIMCACICVYLRIFVCNCVCMCVSVYVCACDYEWCVRVYIYTHVMNIFTYINAYIHTYIPTCIHVFICIHACACIQTTTKYLQILLGAKDQVSCRKCVNNYRQI